MLTFMVIMRFYRGSRLFSKVYDSKSLFRSSLTFIKTTSLHYIIHLPRRYCVFVLSIIKYVHATELDTEKHICRFDSRIRLLTLLLLGVWSLIDARSSAACKPGRTTISVALVPLLRKNSLLRRHDPVF